MTDLCAMVRQPIQMEIAQGEEAVRGVQETAHSVQRSGFHRTNE